MSFSEEYSGTNGTWGTEYSLTGATASVQAQTQDGIYSAWISCDAMDRGDKYVLRAYEKVESAGTQRLCFQHTLPGWGLMPDGICTTPPFMMLHGWDFTLQRIVGTDRTITWSVRGVEGNTSEAFAGADTITTTEFFLASDSTTKTKQTTAGLYQVFLDLNAVAKSDEFELKCYEEARDADTSDFVTMRALLKGDKKPDIYVTPTLLLDNGWEFSLDKIAGTDRSIPRSIRKVA